VACSHLFYGDFVAFSAHKGISDSTDGSSSACWIFGPLLIALALAAAPPPGAPSACGP